MRSAARLAVGTVALLALAACTPEEEAQWRSFLGWTDDVQLLADTQQRPCPQYAVDLAWRHLPGEFHAVIWNESRCNPAAVNGSSGALGLTQIMPFWLGALCPLGIACTDADLLEPGRNLDAAAVIFAAQGPDAWSQTWPG